MKYAKIKDFLNTGETRFPPRFLEPSPSSPHLTGHLVHAVCFIPIFQKFVRLSMFSKNAVGLFSGKMELRLDEICVPCRRSYFFLNVQNIEILSSRTYFMNILIYYKNRN